MKILDKNKFILGTVQFGQRYGVTNFTNKLNKKNIFKILSFAWENNVNFFDTAPSYNTEELIGEFSKANGIQNKIKVITKVPEIKEENKIEYFIRSSVEKSMKSIGTKINTLFFHQPRDIEMLIDKEDLLMQIKKDYNIKNIGFSIYNINERKKLLKFSFKPAIQYPLSIANQSFKRYNFGKEKNFARSIFLQGLLLNKKTNNYKKLAFSLRSSSEKYHNLLDFKKIDPLKLSLSFVSNIKNIDFFLLGVDNISQLKAIINCKLINKIDPRFIKKLNLFFNKNDTDPRNW
jgi:aryl-alcohol dehydrogenase-like predicted oxidoreductase